MSSRKATESFCFVHTMQYIYEEDNKSALECLGRQAMFKFRALWSVRDGKGLRTPERNFLWNNKQSLVTEAHNFSINSVNVLITSFSIFVIQDLTSH